MTITIYALVDPFDQRVRYVGKTAQPARTRLRAHVNRAAGQRHLRSAAWIDALVLAGTAPGLRILETVEGDWEPAERFWIASFRAVGADLLNMTRGGAATPGCPVSDSARAKISVAARAQFDDPARRDAAAEYARAAWRDPEFRADQTAHRRRVAADPAFRANQSAKKKAAWQDPAFREKVLATKATTGCQSKGALKMWERPEYREAQRLARERRYGPTK